jgi:hypothetical protein
MVNCRSRLIGRTKKESEKSREAVTRLDEIDEECATSGYTRPISNITDTKKPGRTVLSENKPLECLHVDRIPLAAGRSPLSSERKGSHSPGYYATAE